MQTYRPRRRTATTTAAPLAAIAALALVPTPAGAGTHTLTIAADQGTISCTEHSKNAASVSQLFAGGAADTLSAGDTVTFTPNGSYSWDAGSGSGWSPAVGATGSTWLDINGNGVLLTESTNTAETGVITLSNISGVLVRNLTLKNIHASSAASPALAIKSTSAIMYDIVVRDVTIVNPTYHERASGSMTVPHIMIEQEDSPEYPIYVSLERVRCNMDALQNGRPICNLINDGNTAMTRRGLVYFIDCDFSGIDYTSDASTSDLADDALGCNASADVYVIGGKYHDCEGAGVTQNGGNNTYTRVVCHGVEAFNCNARPAPGTLGGGAAIVASVIDSCYVHHSTNGVATFPYTPQASQVAQDLYTIRNTQIVRDPMKRLAGTVQLFGIQVATRNTLLENNVVSGYHEGHTTAGPDFGVLVAGTSDSMEGGSLTMVHNWINDCRRHVSDNTSGSSRCLYYDFIGNLFTLSRASLGTASTDKVRVWNIFTRDANRPSVIRARDNVAMIDITTAETDYLFYLGTDVVNSGSANGSAFTAGYNYWWRNVNKQFGFLGTPYVLSASDLEVTSAGTKPLLDTFGRQLPSSPSLTYGKATFDVDAAYQSILASGSNATTDGAGTSFDSASYADWTVPGIVAGDVVRILSGTGATAGVYEITTAAAGALTLERSAGASASAIVFRVESSTSNVNPGQYAYGTIGYTTTAAGTVPRNTNMTFTLGSGTAAVTENHNYTGNSLLCWYDGADAGSVADVIMLRRIAEDKAGVIQIDFPLCNLPASTAITLQCLVIPPVWPANMDLTNSSVNSLLLAPQWERYSSDVFGRYNVASGVSGVAVTAPLLGLGRGVPGPFAYTPPRTDFRSAAPPRGWYPGRTDPLSNLRN